MHIYYHPIYGHSIHADARFPRERYWRVREEWTSRGLDSVATPRAPSPAAVEDLLLVHTRDWVDRFVEGRLTEAEIRRIGFRPWTDDFVERTLTIMGGTLEALDALNAGHRIAANMAGGTHHAFADRGEGYCVFNDLAVAARVAQRRHQAQRVLIVDLDVHQGNGTADIFADEPDVFTYSVHGERNYPFRKPPSDLDIGLPDNASDADVLRVLDQTLPGVFSTFNPDIVFYQAGVDGLKEDRLGRTAFTRAGLRARNDFVFDLCASWRVPLLITMGGGYSTPIEHAVEAHCDVFEMALNQLTQATSGDPASESKGTTGRT
jgi:acetoin utilization deacetylase AcuC-like enzyme